ncbi:MAG: chorismate synthase [Tannerellaceae bacterium]|jgi:chorismate synthase|nr:chorismate synthase [Tannerellaceae bacterium]
MQNTFGNIFRLTTFGESHGPAIGGVIDGCPPGIAVDYDFIRRELDRRKPGQSAITTSRKESDAVTFLSGIYEDQTTGAPIGFTIANENTRPQDYDDIQSAYRPSHSDYTYQMKYGIRDPRGGGRSSARETAARCVGGSIAKLGLKARDIHVCAYTSQIGHIRLEGSWFDHELCLTDENSVRCPDADTAAEMEALIRKVKSKGDSIGGIVSCVIYGVPPGIGEPIYGKLHAALAHAMLSINAAKGFEYGDGFDAALYKGSEHNDAFYSSNGHIGTSTNYSGGIQGGISNGGEIYFRVAFKAAPTILMDQQTVDIDGNSKILKAKGRHDACVVPRATPVVEAMAAMTVFDYLLLQRMR